MHSNVKSRQFITQYPLLFHAPYYCLNLTLRLLKVLWIFNVQFFIFIWGGDFALLLFQPHKSTKKKKKNGKGGIPNIKRETSVGLFVRIWATICSHDTTESDFELLFLLKWGREIKWKFVRSATFIHFISMALFSIYF